MNARRSAVALTVSALCCAGCGADVEPHITASNPVVGAVPGDSAAVYVELENSGGDDALIGATCDCDAEISLHVTEDLDGISIMTGADRLDVPTGSTLELDPGGSHLMVQDLQSPLTAGSTIDITLHFERSEDLSVTVPVVPLEDLAERIEN
ncbi:MAG: copper chaperone PCu(A)C [Microthrixaceae bacterium]